MGKLPPIAPPAHPHRRRKPLPSHLPKADDDDAEAPRRVAALVASASYLEADRDADFMNSDAARGVRLQLDYLKADLELARRGIRHTIVVFGSTRIAEPKAAARYAEACRREAGEHPGSVHRARQAAIAGRLLENSRYYDVARELGRLVGSAAAASESARVVVLTGGGPGIMEAANRGAHDAGAPSIGLNISLPQDQFPNPYVSPELCFRFHYFGVRKLHFLLRARALVAFPGGYGTFDELFETLALVQTRKIPPMPIVLVGQSFWRRAFDVDFLVDEGVIEPEDRELFWFAETAQEIRDGIDAWYAMAGRRPDVDVD